jgi:hypothetical protein
MKFLEVTFNALYANSLMIKTLQTSVINLKLKQTIQQLKDPNDNKNKDGDKNE